MLHDEALPEQLFSTNLFYEPCTKRYFNYPPSMPRKLPNLRSGLAKKNDRTPTTEPSTFSVAKTYTPELSPSPAQVTSFPRDRKRNLELSPPTTPKKFYHREEKAEFAAVICCKGLPRFDCTEIEGFGNKKEELSPQQISREKRQIMFRKLSQGRHEEMESFRALLKHADGEEIAQVVKKVKVEREEEVVEVARKLSSSKTDDSEGDLHLARATIFYTES